MATLEKIRSKSVLLIVIIGVALLAFIIGDFFTSGRTLFGSGTTVAKVDGHKLDVMDFQRRMELHNRQDQQTGRKTDAAQLQQQVINEMVSEALYQDELKRLGLTVTDAELQDLMLGRGAIILNNRVMQESQGQIQSINELHSRITRPADYGMTPDQVQPLTAYWRQLETEMEQQLLQQKFFNLFSGAITANALDAKALYDENAEIAHIALARKNFATVSNEGFDVSDQELNNEWAQHKNSYQLNEPTRTVSYITVSLVPSSEDILAGQQRVETALARLRSSDDPTVLSDMTDFVVETERKTPSAIRNTRVKNYLDTVSVGTAGIVNRNANSYTIVKLLGKTVEVDSVCFDFVAVSGQQQLDSIKTALNSGTKLSALEGNPAVVSSQDSLWVSLLDPASAQLKEALSQAPVGVFFTPDTIASAQGGRLFRVTRRRPAVPVYEYSTVSYTVDPSAATVGNLETALNDYVTANSNAQDFINNAIEAGYQVLPAKVSPSSPMLGNLSDSRGAVVWALDAKKGQVSPVFGGEQTGRLIAVALTDVYDDFTPARDPQVRDYLTGQVRNRKKGDAMLSDYSGKANDVAGYAALMGAPVDTITFNFGQVYVQNVGMGESEFQARAALADKGKVVGPFAGNQGIYVFEIVDVDAPARPYTYEESARQFSSNRGSYVLVNMLPSILLGNKKVDNRLSTFYRE